ncbi:MAG: MFS transporter [Ottowia sp.]|nr:MFS transporter [Ottowia sp.]
MTVERGTALYSLLARLNVRPREARVLLLAWLYVVTLFMAYYMLRPLRDEIGAAGGVRNLPWLFVGTLGAMLALSPLFGALVQRWPRERFIALSYRFFALHLLLFALVFGGAESGARAVWAERVFFIWVSVFNLFVVSVFWSLMADVFSSEQGKRLFGILAAGATVGGIIGPALVKTLSARVSHWQWLLLSAALLEVAVWLARSVSRSGGGRAAPQEAQGETQNIGGSAWAGLQRTLQSPYLMGISAFILLYSITSTLLYFQQAEIVNANFTERAARTAFFAQIDLWVNSLTLGFQLFITGRLMQRLGIAFTLAALPLVSMAGFGLLASFPILGVFVLVQVGRRVSNFALARPSREVLFTQAPREDRYKAKNFIDTVVYRSGDQIGAWGYAGLSAGLGLSLSAISWLAVPLCAVWLLLALWLGRTARGGEQAHG